MPTIAPGVTQLVFDPGQGMKLLMIWEQLPTQIYDPDTQKPTQAIPRYRVDAADVGTGLFTLLSTAEILAVWRDTGTMMLTPNQLTLGDSVAWARKAARAQDPIGIGYMAAQNIARWACANFDPPMKDEPQAQSVAPTMPGGNAPATGSGAPGAPISTVSAPIIAITVGVIGVAAALAGAVAYWAGKRQDAQASMRADTLRAAGVTATVLELAQSQIAAGQQLDPRIFDTLKAVGAGKEVSRDWGAPLAAAGGGVLVAGSAGAVAYATK